MWSDIYCRELCACFMPLIDTNEMPSAHNPLDGGLRNSIFIGKEFLGYNHANIFSFYLSSLFVCKYCISSLFSFAVREAFSFRSILSVFFGSSDIKMFRITAWRIVAFVENPLAFGYFPKRKFPSHPMGIVMFPIKFEGAVAKMLKRANIIPTLIFRLYNHLVPKSHGHWCSFRFPCFQRRFPRHVCIMWNREVFVN